MHIINKNQLLFGWHVILQQQGYQDLHIHPAGWLSGVIYLKVVPSLEKNEGAIEFSLNAQNYSDLKSPKFMSPIPHSCPDCTSLVSSFSLLKLEMSV